MRKVVIPFKLFEQIFSIISLLIFTEPRALIVLFSDLFLAGKVSLFYNLFYILCGFASILLLAFRWENTAKSFIRCKSIWFLLLIFMTAALSCLWSFSSLLTLKRALYVGLTTCFGVYFATRFKPSEQVTLLGCTFSLAILLSLIFGFFLPSYGVMGGGKALNIQEQTHTGLWRGIYVHKNVLGRIMSLAGPILFIAANSNKNFRYAFGIALAGLFFLILASESVTGLITLLTLLALLQVYRILRWNYSLLVPIGLIIVLILSSFTILVGSNAAAVVGIFGRDLTFSGRTVLWVSVLDEISQNPWLGYGYRAYWQGFWGPSAALWAQFPWLPPHSHNGLLDIALDLGVVGVTIFLIGFLAISSQAYMCIRSTKTWLGLFPIIFLNYMFLTNISESSLLGPNIAWVIYLTIPFFISKVQ